MFFQVILTLLVAIIGGFIAQKLKFPAPFMLGAMLGVAIFNIITGNAYMPSDLKVFTQAISGAYIGLSISRSDIKSIAKLIEPILVLIICFLTFTTVMGCLFYYVFDMDIATSFLVVIPGGVTEISLMAHEVGAEPDTVSFMQTFRLFAVYLTFPSIITSMSKKYNMGNIDHEEYSEEKREYWIDKYIPNNVYLQQIIIVIIAIIAGYIGKASGVPAGTLSFSLIATMLIHFNSNKLHLDKKYKKGVQVIAGSLVGESIGMETILHLNQLIVPTIIMIIAYIIANFIISYLMKKTYKIDRISAMFASSPSGASDMTLIASEIGENTPKIAICQIVRLVCCYTIFPIWVKFLIGILE